MPAQEKSGKITVMVYDRGLLSALEGTLNNNRWTEWIRENAPVDQIDWIPIPRAEVAERINIMFASGSAPDIISNFDSLLTAIQTGHALELTEEMLNKVPHYKALLKAYPGLRKLVGANNGKIYSFGKIANVSANHCLMIRKDWLDELGLSMPQTPEDILSIAHAFTYDDPDGNGIDDTYGINMTSDAQRWLSHMFGFPNPEKYAMIDGELVYVWDRIESWLTYAEQFVDQGLTNPDFLIRRSDDDKIDFLSGKLGIYIQSKLLTPNTGYVLYSDFIEANPHAAVETFAMPETQYGSFTGYSGGGFSTETYINASAHDVDACLRFINWMYDAEVSRMLEYGPEGEYYSMDEEGTYIVIDAKKNEIERNYAYDYIVVKSSHLDAADANSSYGDYTNSLFNVYLKSEDPIQQDYGSLLYEVTKVANRPGSYDPRKWLQALPALPADLALIKSTADLMVNDILKHALADPAISAAQAVAAAKNVWQEADGLLVDEHYAAYYKARGEDALTAQDYMALQRMPELLPKAKRNFKNGD
ncbi:MAG: hypothetical protein ACOX8S_07545 [Christensenellales bacterium]